MTPVLVVTEGPLTGQRVELDRELVLGREDAGLTIEDPEISRRHAVIRPAAGGLEIEDLGSRNGTFVNGTRIGATTQLAGNDTIKLGRTVLQVEAARAAATVASAVPAAAATAAAPIPVAATAPGNDAVPGEAFGTYAAPAASGHTRGVASRQLGPQLIAFAVVAATAVTLALYFSQH